MAVGSDSANRSEQPPGDAESAPARPSADSWIAGHTTYSLEDGASEEQLVNEFSLSVLSGPDAGARFKSKEDRAVVGTHESATFVLHDPTVSRFHCEIAVHDGAISIRDLGSTNGTSTSGVRVFHARLENGTVVSLGKTDVRLELGPVSVRVPLSTSDRFGLLVGR